MPTQEEQPIEGRATSSEPAREIPTSTQIQDKRAQPKGVLPKQTQTYVIAGLALLILLALLFSKSHTRVVSAGDATGATTQASNVNQQRIQELEENLNADQQEAERQQNQPEQSQRVAIPPTENGTESPATQPAGDEELSASPPVSQPQPNPIVQAEKTLAFQSRFASNLVTPMQMPAATQVPANSAAAPGSILEQSATAKPRSTEVNIDAAHGRPYVIFEGTMINTVLTNRLDSDFAGPVKVMVTNPVYSRDGQHVLIPSGTFILGRTQKVGSMGQTRLAVTFHRMIMPDGYSVDLDQFHGLDQIGDTGLQDQVNHHYLRIFGASIALGLIAGAAEATTNDGYAESGSDLYRQGIASSLAQSSAHVLDRFINILPTITIREGHRIKVYLTQDLILPAYSNHNMPGVM